MIPVLLKEFHDSVIGGHAGEIKTYLRLAADWFWEGMRRDVGLYVQQCNVCQQMKNSQRSPAGLLQPLPLPDLIWEEISLDFIDGLPLSKGYNSILVVVDRLSKYAHFLGLRHPYTATTVAGVFIKEIVRLHGFPTAIVSDRDRIFMSNFWSELFRIHGTTLKKSSAYHPQTDGQTEIVNKTLETYLRCFIQGKTKTWAEWLPWAEFSYNTSPHSSTKFSPFKMVYGRDPPTLLRVGRSQSPMDSVEEMLQVRDAVLDELHVNLLRAQNRMKKMADTKRREASFDVGDSVFLKLQPYRQSSLVSRPCEKLSARFFGPFTILQRIGQVAYKLDLPGSCKIHPMFHISQLKKCVGTDHVSATIPDQISADLELCVEPEELLAVRPVQGGQPSQMEVLIKWKQLPTFEATWEDMDNIKIRFPVFNLEDKVRLWGRSNVTDQAQPNKSLMFTRRKPKGKKVKTPEVNTEEG